MRLVILNSCFSQFIYVNVLSRYLALFLDLKRLENVLGVDRII